MPTPERIASWADDPCFYVSVRDAGNFDAVAGPFRSLAMAVAALPAARKIGADVDPKSVFYGWGTVKMANGYREGRLNENLAAVNSSILCGEWDYTEEHVHEAARLEKEAEKNPSAPTMIMG